MPKQENYFLVLTTVAKKTEAKNIAKALVKDKLAACVTILPQGESCYTWQGKLCIEKEYVLLIKTKKILFAKLTKKITSQHSYECPEIIGVPIQKISETYAKWLKNGLPNSN